MKLELKPEEITLTSIKEQIKGYMYFTGEAPKNIEMTLKQLEKFAYLCVGMWGTFDGIPITVYGKRIRTIDPTTKKGKQ